MLFIYILYNTLAYYRAPEKNLQHNHKFKKKKLITLYVSLVHTYYNSNATAVNPVIVGLALARVTRLGELSPNEWAIAY
jgi:hypothetical protein